MKNLRPGDIVWNNNKKTVLSLILDGLAVASDIQVMFLWVRPKSDWADAGYKPGHITIFERVFLEPLT